MKTKEKGKLYQPTEAVKNNITRGIALKAKYKHEALSALENNKHVPLMQESLTKGFSVEVIKQMYNELKDSQVDFRKRLAQGVPSEEIIKHYLFGGSAGLAWAKLVLKDAGVLDKGKALTTPEALNKDGDDKSFGSLQVTKSADPVLKQATFIVMTPDEIDLHGDVTNAEEVRKACHNFNKHSMQANLFHLAMTDTFEFAESYIAPADFILDDKFVMKGTWLCTIQVLDDDLWDGILKGEFVGVSIGAMANVEELEVD